MDRARWKCQDLRELSYEMPAPDTWHQMAGPCPKCWSHNPDRSPLGDWPHYQTPQCHFWSHRQDAEQCPSTSGPKLPGRPVSRSTPGSFRGSVVPVVLRNDGWTKSVTTANAPSRCVERRCQTRSSWSDAMVLNDYALMTTSCVNCCVRRWEMLFLSLYCSVSPDILQPV